MKSTVVHRPLRPPRTGTPDEGIWAALWQATMAEQWEEEGDDVTPFEAVLYHYPRRPGQREATILASLVTWFGLPMDVPGYVAWCDEWSRHPGRWVKRFSDAGSSPGAGELS